MKDWTEIQIKELGRVVTGKTPPTSDRSFFDGSYRFVSPKDMDFDSRYIRNTLTTITQKAIEKFKNQVLPIDSIMFTSLSYGFGKIGITDTTSLTNQQINSIIVDEKNHDFNFVYYLLRHYKDRIFSYNAGIVTPIVPKSVFEKIKVFVPSNKKSEVKIASILSAYDDLIENNLKRIKLLEEKAQLHYKELIANSGKWDVVKLENFVSVVKGRKPANVLEQPEEESQPYLLLETVERKKTHYTTDLSLPQSKITDVLMCMDGARSGLSFRGMDGAIGSTMAIWRSNSVNVSGEFLYQFMKQNESAITQGNTGAAIPHANRKFILDMEIVLPPKNEANYFDELTTPIIKLINTLHNKNAKLREARDILLPRSLSDFSFLMCAIW